MNAKELIEHMVCEQSGGSHAAGLLAHSFKNPKHPKADEDLNDVADYIAKLSGKVSVKTFLQLALKKMR